MVRQVVSTHADGVLRRVTIWRNVSHMGQNAVEQAVSVIDYTIGENVDTLRKRAGFTKDALGARFGVGGSAMSLKISGKRAWSAQDIQFAAELFGVRMAQLQGEESMPEPDAPATVTDITTKNRMRRTPDYGSDTWATITSIGKPRTPRVDPAYEAIISPIGVGA